MGILEKENNCTVITFGESCKLEKIANLRKDRNYCIEFEETGLYMSYERFNLDKCKAILIEY